MTLAHYMILELRRASERESFSPNWKSGYWLLRFGVCISVRVYEYACLGGEEQTNERTKATQSHCMLSPPTPHSRHLSEQDHKE